MLHCPLAGITPTGLRLDSGTAGTSGGDFDIAVARSTAQRACLLLLETYVDFRQCQISALRKNLEFLANPIMPTKTGKRHFDGGEATENAQVWLKNNPGHVSI